MADLEKLEHELYAEIYHHVSNRRIAMNILSCILEADIGVECYNDDCDKRILCSDCDTRMMPITLKELVERA